MDGGLKVAIRHFRERRGLTQQDCSIAAGMPKTGTWSNLERDRGRADALSLEELETVASTVGTTTEGLIRKARELEGE